MIQDDAKDGNEIDEVSAAAADAPDAASSDGSATNWALAGIVAGGASDLLRKTIEKRAGGAAPKPGKDELRELDGKTIITTLGLYGASRLATRSVGGLVAVAGGLLAKTLYDRGKARQRRKRGERDEE